MKQHVGNALADGEVSAGLWADESSLFDMELEESVVEFLEEVMGVEHGRFCLVWKLWVAEGARGVDEGLPFDLGEDVFEEIRVEIDLLFHGFLHLEAEREAVMDFLFTIVDKVGAILASAIRSWT